jgi:hypothetical protein
MTQNGNGKKERLRKKPREGAAVSGVKRAEEDDRSKPPMEAASLRRHSAIELRAEGQCPAALQNLQPRLHSHESHKNSASKAPYPGTVRIEMSTMRNDPDTRPRPRRRRDRR